MKHLKFAILLCSFAVLMLLPACKQEPISTTNTPYQDGQFNCPRLAVLLSQGRNSLAAIVEDNKTIIIPKLKDATSVSWTPDGKQLIMLTSKQIWRVNTDKQFQYKAMPFRPIDSFIIKERANKRLGLIICNPINDKVIVEIDGVLYLLNWSDPQAQVIRVIKSHTVNPSPVWSPDGKSLAYISEIDNHHTICIYDVVKQKEQIILTASKNSVFIKLQWASDSLHLIYILSPIEDAKPGQVSPPLYSLNLISLVTKNTIELLNNKAYVYDVAWRPGSNQIAVNLFWRGIFLITKNNTSLRPVPGAAIQGTNPVWSSDGKWLAFNFPNKQRNINDLVIRDMVNNQDLYIPLPSSGWFLTWAPVINHDQIN